jgi:hypothetical protein
MNLRKKMQEEKTLSRRQFLTTFRTPMTTPAALMGFMPWPHQFPPAIRMPVPAHTKQSALRVVSLGRE